MVPPPRIEDRLARRGGLIELLRLPALIFGLGSALRAALYEREILPVERLDVPVVSIGNLTAGGTGKTPMVAFVARALARRGIRPGILSRGYGSKAADGTNDEARLLSQLLPDVPHVQDADRARGGRALEEQVDAIVLDDGFQHRRLQRDLDLVLVDATRPWGLPALDGRAPVRALLPRGLLREPLSALARASAIVITRSDQIEPAALAELRAELQRAAPAVPLLTAAHAAQALHSLATNERTELGELRGRDVDLVSGIGNPDAFERSVVRAGARVAQHRRFPDHHAYGERDLDGLGAGGRWLLTTSKDAVKLAALAAAPASLRTFEIEMRMLEGAAVLEALLDSLPAGRALRERRTLHEGLHG